MYFSGADTPTNFSCQLPELGKQDLLLTQTEIRLSI